MNGALLCGPLLTAASSTTPAITAFRASLRLRGTVSAALTLAAAFTLAVVTDALVALIFLYLAMPLLVSLEVPATLFAITFHTFFSAALAVRGRASVAAVFLAVTDILMPVPLVLAAIPLVLTPIPLILAAVIMVFLDITAAALTRRRRKTTHPFRRLSPLAPTGCDPLPPISLRRWRSIPVPSLPGCLQSLHILLFLGLIGLLGNTQLLTQLLRSLLIARLHGILHLAAQLPLSILRRLRILLDDRLGLLNERRTRTLFLGMNSHRRYE